MRILRWVLLVLVGLYVLIEVAACSFQERFIYFPDPTLAVLPEASPYQEIHVETPDGERLLAWTMDAAPGCPTMLFFHGNGISNAIPGAMSACARPVSACWPFPGAAMPARPARRPRMGSIWMPRPPMTR